MDIEKRSIIKLAGIDKGYTKGDTRVDILENLNLSIKEGDFLALMGPSGSGKSTLLEIIAGITSPDGGELSYRERNANGMSADEKSDWRNREIGFVFQAYNLMPHLTALENIKVPLIPARMSAKESTYRAELCLELVGMQDYRNRYPAELSGGQEQRVAIARAIINNPSLILADEPTGNLDANAAASVLSLLRELNRLHNKTILLVTHDLTAAGYAKKTISLDKGQIHLSKVA